MSIVDIAGSPYTVDPLGRVELVATRRDAMRGLLALSLAGLLLAGACAFGAVSMYSRDVQLSATTGVLACAFGAAGGGSALVLRKVRALRRDPGAWRIPARRAPLRPADAGASWGQILRPPRAVGPVLVGIAALGFIGSVLMSAPVPAPLEVLGLCAVGIFLTCLLTLLALFQSAMVWVVCARIVLMFLPGPAPEGKSDAG